MNRNAGIFVKNFYQPILRPKASDKEQMTASRITTLVLGIVIVAMAMYFNHSKAGLFELMMLFTALVSTPTIIPLLLMFFFRVFPLLSIFEMDELAAEASAHQPPVAPARPTDPLTAGDGSR